MSYDLYFHPRSGVLDRERAAAHFAARPHYARQGDQFWYENPDTGVYFAFRLPSERGGEDALSTNFNLNYNRASFFAMEAEPELAAFVKALDLTVEDPQFEGMGEGDYDSAGFMRGWSKGNAAACKTIAELAASKSLGMPAAKLTQAWRWNFDLQRTRQALTRDLWVPPITFVNVDGAALTAAVWPNGEPSRIPHVDYLVAPRAELTGARDIVLLAWADAAPLLTRHGKTAPGPSIELSYDELPSDVADFVRALPARAAAPPALPAEAIVDAELLTA
jgi:hypothetical protein